MNSGHIQAAYTYHHWGTFAAEIKAAACYPGLADWFLLPRRPRGGR